MANPVCSTDCTDILPIARFPECGYGSLVKESEIGRIFIGKRSRTPFTDWTAEAEWVAAVDNTGTADTDQTLRVYDVIGDLPAGTPVSKVISKKRTLTITKNRTLAFTIDVISDETYNGMRQYECGGTYRMWFETIGGVMYGGNNGILVTLDPNISLGRGDATEEILGAVSWQAKFMPERTLSPIFEGETTNDDDIANTAPVFTVQPSAQTISEGNNFTLTATSTGADTYQWQVSSDGTTFTNLSGATSESYTVTHALIAAGGTYRRVDTNDIGPTNSNAVLVTVNARTFQNVLTFTSAASASAVGVSFNVGTTSTHKKFEFDTVASGSATGRSMSVTIGGTEQGTSNYPDRYTGATFRYTAENDSVHYGNFADPTAAV